RPPHGDLNNEPERTGTNDNHGGRPGTGADAGAGGGADGGVLPPEQAHLAAVSGRRGRRPGASAAGAAPRAAQTPRPAGAGPCTLCAGTLRRLRPDTDGRTTGEEKAGGGSRDAAPVADGGRP